MATHQASPLPRRRTKNKHQLLKYFPSIPIIIIINTSAIIKQLRSLQRQCNHATHRFTLLSSRGSRDPEDLRISIPLFDAIVLNQVCSYVVSHGVHREEAGFLILMCERPFEMVGVLLAEMDARGSRGE